MHILLIHQAFTALDEAGGTRHYELALHLVERGHRVTVITSPVSYLTGQARGSKVAWIERSSPAPGIEVLRSYTYPAFHKSFFHRLIGFFSFMISSFLTGLSVRHVDLVWGTSPPIFQGVTAWLLARLKRVPFLFEVRDLWPAFAIAVGVLKNPLLVGASLWLERFLYRHADQVIVNSPGFIDHVTRRGARQVELIPNGADPAMFAPDSCGSDFRSRHGLDGKFVALYAGAHGLSNDLGILLEAACRLKGQDHIRFVLVGDGKEKSNLQKQAALLRLDNLLFLPAVPKSAMTDVLAASDACIAILKPIEMYKTTYPNKVFDYMAAGRPVILAIGGVIREVVESAQAGLYISPGDPTALAGAVEMLAGDPALARKQGMAGLQFIKDHFDRGQLAQQLTAVIENMSKKHARKNPAR